MNEKADALAQMDIPFLRQPVDAQLDALTVELRTQWLALNRELKQGKLTHLDYDKDTQTLIWRKPKGENQKVREQSFYEQPPYCDVADVFRFVNEVSGERQRQGRGADHHDFTGGLAAHPAERALHLPERR